MIITKEIDLLKKLGKAGYLMVFKAALSAMAIKGGFKLEKRRSKKRQEKLEESKC